MIDPLPSQVGAHYLGNNKTYFRVWAPATGELAVRRVGTQSRQVFLEPEENGYFTGIVPELRPGDRYYFELAGVSRPDPASRFQPQGVAGPSEIIAPHYAWTDTSWRGLPLREYVIYELHVGTFSAEGTFAAIIERLDDLKELGITALELMPVAQFPGARNWGYDGVFPFAVQNSYGGPLALRGFINACHERGLAVILDVVYNHLGPEGNCFADYGPYFTGRYRTPWGDAINFDGSQSDEVRRFFIENALYWLRDCHADALRLDALHAIHDMSAVPFLEELSQIVDAEAEDMGRRLYLFAESDLNDPRLVRPREQGGLGLHALWNEDFHHALHAKLTGEKGGYYADFGSLEALATAYRDGFVYGGRYSRYRRCHHGRSSRDVRANQFVVFSQNHDQVGNRVKSDRLSTLLSLEELKLAAALVILSPYLPLLFMGEEYGETAPFYYFVDHKDPALRAAVRNGRLREFAAFEWAWTPPDPSDGRTFEACRLNYETRKQGLHARLHAFYKELLRLRREIPALADLTKETLEVSEDDQAQIMTVKRHDEKSAVWIAFNLGEQKMTRQPPLGYRTLLLDSAARRWCLEDRGDRPDSKAATGILPPKSVIVLGHEGSEI